MKMAKRTLAVVLSLLMAFSVFSVVGSAKINTETIAGECWDGAGTIRYGLDVYKVVGDSYTKLDSGTTLSPNDVVEVRVKFGTDFYCRSITTQVFYETKYFVALLDGVATEDAIGNVFDAGFVTEYPDDVPVVTLDSGASGTFYDTLSKGAGRSGCINRHAETSIWRNNFPSFMRQGYNGDNTSVKKATPLAAAYATTGLMWTIYTVSTDTDLEGECMKVPYATYFSFRMQVKEGADTEGALTSIYIPLLAQRSSSSATYNNNKLAGQTALQAAWNNEEDAPTWGQGIDVTDGEFEAKIGQAVHEHTWNDGEVTKAATCTEAGEMTYTCTSCGETKTEAIDALGHDYVETVVPATCTEGGYTLHKCSRCGNEFTTDETEAAGHQWNDGEVTKAATCSEEGEMALTCTVCGETTTAVIEIDPDAHSWGDWEIYDDDYHERFCLYDNNHSEQKAHEWAIDEDLSFPATDEDDGQNVYSCSLCGHQIIEIIHVWNEGEVTTPATCTDAGEMTYTCVSCGETKTEAIDALGHDYVETVVPATCTEGGYTLNKCSRCGNEIKTDETAALGHSWNAGETTTAPTCTDAGEATYTCTVCGETKTEPVDALGHDYVQTVIAPTCTEGGYTLNKCSRCGDEFTSDETAAAGHKWNDGETTTAPTCTDTGEATYTCTVCGETKTEPVDALGHDYVQTVIAPTCTEGGYTLNKCSRCGDEFTSDETAAAGHKWNDGEVTTAPTCTDKGEATFTCTVCGETKTEPIDALGHDYVQTVIAPTCTEGGYTLNKCSRCGDEFTTDETAALGHNWNSGEVTKAATCCAEGETTYTCSVCGATRTETIAVDPEAHAWDEGKVTKEPTETAEGEMTYTCKNDPSHTKTEAIAKLPASELLLTASVRADVTENAISVTVPYSRKGKIAFQLTASTASEENMEVTYTSSNPKLMTVDKDGNVKFTRLNIFSKTVDITAKTADGRTATCKVTIELKWWQYIIWFLLGGLWF